MEPIGEGSVYFSYSQFFVYDAALVSPGCDWTEEHTRQGFARRDASVAVGTLAEYGRAAIRLYMGLPATLADYERAIAISLVVKSGHIAIDGPEEPPGTIRLPVAPGVYRVMIAQRLVGEDALDVGVFIAHDPRGVLPSEILVQDEELDPPTPLVEVAAIPDV